MNKSKAKPKPKRVCLAEKEFNDYYRFLWERSKIPPDRTKNGKRDKCVTPREYRAFKSAKQRRKVRDSFVSTINTY